MGGHDQLTAPLYTRFEGHHFACQHLGPGFLRIGISEVCVCLSVTMAREMFDTAGHTGILQTLKVIDHHRSCLLGIVAEGSGTDDNILWIGIHVGHRGEVDVETVAVQIGANGVAALVGIARVACGDLYGPRDRPLRRYRVGESLSDS